MVNSIRNITLNSLISIILKFLLIILFPYLIYLKQYLFALSALIAIMLSLIPAILKRNYNINLPWGIDFLITLVLYLHTAGLTFKFYKTVFYYDIITHILGTIVIALLGFIMIYTLYFTKKIHLSIPLIGFFTIIFAIAVGALWEIGEFAIDSALGTNAQISNSDTMSDLIFDSLAGIFTSIVAMYYVKTTPENKLSEMIHPFNMLLNIKNKNKFERLSALDNEGHSKDNNGNEKNKLV